MERSSGAAFRWRAALIGSGVVGLIVGLLSGQLLTGDPSRLSRQRAPSDSVSVIEARGLLATDSDSLFQPSLCSVYGGLARSGMQERRPSLVETGVRGLARCRTEDAQRILAEVIQSEHVQFPNRAGEWFGNGFRGVRSPAVADAALKRWTVEAERQDPVRSRRLDPWLWIIAETGEARHLEWLVGNEPPYLAVDLGRARALAASTNPLATEMFRSARTENAAFRQFDTDHIEANRGTLLSFLPGWIDDALGAGDESEAALLGAELVARVPEAQLEETLRKLRERILAGGGSAFSVPVAQALAARGVDPDGYAAFVTPFDDELSAVGRAERGSAHTEVVDLTYLFRDNPVLWSKHRLQALKASAGEDILSVVEQWLAQGWRSF